MPKKKRKAKGTDIKPTTAAELARRLGVRANSLGVHIRSGLGPPIGDVEAWVEFLAIHGRQGTMPEDARKDMAETRRRLVEAQALKIERENKVADGLLVPVDEVEQGLKEVMAEMFSTLERIWCSEMPPLLSGLNEVEIRGKCQKEIDEMKARIRERFDELSRRTNKE